MRFPAWLALVLGVLCASSAAHAQTAADLRYAASMPISVTYISVDTMDATLAGTPMGNLETRATIRSASDILLTPAGDSLRVTATLREMTGEVSGAMGSMPLNAGPEAPMDFTMGATGPREELALEALQTSSAAGPAAVSSARALSALPQVPGRTVRLGETWTDTAHHSPTVEGMDMNVVVVTQGTYTGDTVSHGRTVNVLRITSTVTLEAAGTVQGMTVHQQMTTTVHEVVHWDPVRHIPVLRDGTSEMATEMHVREQDMTLKTTARSRSVTMEETAAGESGESGEA